MWKKMFCRRKRSIFDAQQEKRIFSLNSEDRKLHPLSPTFSLFTFHCRVQRHPFERIATPFQVYSWTAPQVDHAMDCVRAEDAYTSRLGYEEHIPGQVGSPEFSSASSNGTRLAVLDRPASIVSSD